MLFEDGSGLKSWRPLYLSQIDGLSNNRFNAKVLAYKGPTVTLLTLNSGQTFAIGLDEEWRSGSSPLGGSAACAVRMAPGLGLPLQSGKGLLLFQAGGRGPNALLRVGANPKLPLFSTPADFSEIAAMEVFGCGDAAALSEQAKQKAWEMRQVEKAKKVPLPGQWDENPDKTLLEMAGRASAASLGVRRE